MTIGAAHRSALVEVVVVVAVLTDSDHSVHWPALPPQPSSSPAKDNTHTPENANGSATQRQRIGALCSRVHSQQYELVSVLCCGRPSVSAFIEHIFRLCSARARKNSKRQSWRWLPLLLVQIDVQHRSSPTEKICHRPTRAMATCGRALFTASRKPRCFVAVLLLGVN